MSILKALASTGGVGVQPTYVDDVYYGGDYLADAYNPNTGDKDFITQIPLNTGKVDPYWDNVGFLLKPSYNAVWKCSKTGATLNIPTSTNPASNSVSGFSNSYGICTALVFGSNSDTSDYIQSDLYPTHGQPNMTTPWCIEFVVGGTAGANGGGGLFNFEIGSLGSNWLQIQLSVGGGGGTVYHNATCNLVINGTYYINTSVAVSSGGLQFHHIKVWHDGAVAKVAVNGVVLQSTPCSNFTNSPLATSAYFFTISAGSGVGTGTSGSMRLNRARFTFGASRADEGNVYLDDYPLTKTNGGRALYWFSGIGSAGNTKVWMDTATPTERAYRASDGTYSATTKIPRVSAIGDQLVFDPTASPYLITSRQYVRVFKESPNFFAIATGSSTATLTHTLGRVPSLAIIQPLVTGNQAAYVYSSVFPSGINGNYALLNNTGYPNVSGVSASITATTLNCTALSITGNVTAYLFADDSSPNGIIRVMSFTTDASGNATVTTGWEPQHAMIKLISGGTGLGNWLAFDTGRNWIASGSPEGAASTCNYLNTTAGNNDNAATSRPTQTGFTFTGDANATYVVMAIRRSNKPPTSGTQVYNSITRTGSASVASVTGVGFAPDLVTAKFRGLNYPTTFFDKVRGANLSLASTSVAPEFTNTNALTSFDADGWTLGSDDNANAGNAFSNPAIFNAFKRAAGVFDIVPYTGVAGSSQEIPHGLGVKPELIIAKCRNFNGYSWAVYAQPVGATHGSQLNNTGGFVPNGFFWNSTEPTASIFTIGSGDDTKPSAGASMIAYLFASLTGISKVGSYTGNGSSLNVDCNFTTGARFVMIKCWDTNGDWYVWDSIRGIVAGNDPHLSLNTAAVEVTTDDSIDPFAAGFTVNQVAATNINVNGGSYVYLAFA